MKTKSKILLLTLCAVALVAASVLGTLAYLTSQDTVTNTFTVGNVKITLDEAKVNLAGQPVNADGEVVAKVADAPRVKANSYKLLPGHEYTKDPTVTVSAGSESSYIKMTVTFTKADALDEIFDPGAILTDIFKGYGSTTWLYQGNTEDTENKTRTYEFWYKDAVAAIADDADDVALEPLFTSIKVPGEIDNDQLATIADMTITVNAYAIQADGFADATAAWAAYNG